MFKYILCLTSFVFAADQESNKQLAELVKNGIDMNPGEVVNVGLSGMNLASFKYPSESDNFLIIGKSAGSSQIMINGEYAFQQVLTITLQAKQAGVGNNPSYLIVKAPESFKIPINVV